MFQFNLGCQEWKRALVGTIHNSGMFMSMLFTGAISDRFGRRVAVGFASLGSLIFGLSRAFTPSYIMFVIMHFLEASTGGGLYASAYVFSEYLDEIWNNLKLQILCFVQANLSRMIVYYAWYFVSDSAILIIILSYTNKVLANMLETVLDCYQYESDI